MWKKSVSRESARSSPSGRTSGTRSVRSVTARSSGRTVTSRPQHGRAAATRRGRRGCCREPGRSRLGRHGDLDHRADAAVVPRALPPRCTPTRSRSCTARTGGPTASSRSACASWPRALRAAGVGPGDRVAYLLPNVPEMLVAHFAVPLAGAVLVAINTRLSAEEVRYICDHSGSVLLVVDAAFAPTVAPVVASLETVRTVVTVVDPHGPPPGDPIPGAIAYADLLAALLERSADDPLSWTVDDERATISINYTSGTTGRPKGVMYTPPRRLPQRPRRAAALRAHPRQRLPVDAADVPLQRLVHGVGAGRDRRHPGVPARGARRRDLAADRRRGGHPPQRRAHRRRHDPRRAAGPRAGPPLVITTAARAAQPDDASRVPSGWASRSCTSTASPRPTVRTRCASGSAGGTGSTPERAGAAAGPAGRRDDPGRADAGGGAELRDGQLVDVPADGATMGEIVMRGNNVMKGYYRRPGGHREGVRGRLVPLRRPRRHAPRRLRRAARPGQGRRHLRRGEHLHRSRSSRRCSPTTPCSTPRSSACPTRSGASGPRRSSCSKAGATATEDGAARPRARPQIARYKAPREVEFVDELPKTSTGKVQKFELREKEWAGQTSRIKG